MQKRRLWLKKGEKMRNNFIGEKAGEHSSLQNNRRLNSQALAAFFTPPPQHRTTTDGCPP
ncbi:uncharacterized protein METZ01_LOCUS65450 [marine metagenome]|uniref:Uncharacterized protein n=1 Tax=marine metagenome TaxID=408172 RepID=A0A381T8T9_9ZZZZ